MKGIFTLTTAADLRAKMHRDLDKLKAAPLDPDAAFNFFVTAEHMRDWVYPNDPAKRKSERDGSALLQVCDHLANGAKHFELTDKRHKSVSATGRKRKGGAWENAWGDSWGDAWGGQSRLYVELEGDAAAQLRRSIGVVELAEKVMDYWDKHPLS